MMKIAMVENAQKRLKSQMLLMMMAAVLISGCGVDSDDGDVVSSIELPTDDSISLGLACEDVGIHTETCVLDDPNNPYVNVIVSEDTKFDLGEDAPSATAKFYLWATALARGAGAPGENQFFTALFLHQMWAENDDELIRLQAIKAYRAYLDHYFGSLHYFEIPVESGNFFPQDINRWVGQMLFDPAQLTNTFTSARLFSDDPQVNKNEADKLVGEWGFFYNQDSETFIKNP